MANKDLEARLAQLEARVQELEDERKIREVLSRYGFNADCHRDREYVELYTDDGVLDLSDGGMGKYDGIVRFEGKAALYEFKTTARPAGLHGQVMHCMGNNVVTHIDGDEAVVDSYSVVLKGSGPNVGVWTAGNNQWRLKKVAGTWLLKERRRRSIGDADFTTNVDATPA
jgi:hypothetical protein